MKLIVFINPKKFKILIATDNGFKEKFSIYNPVTEKSSYYKEEVIYISDNGSYEFGDFSIEKLNTASISIFKDEFNNVDVLSNLVNDFCVLRHGTAPSLISQLAMLSNCKRVIQQMEEIDESSSKNLFFQLANFIGNVNNVEYNTFFEEFVKPLLREKLKVAYTFIEECVGGNPELTLIDQVFNVNQNLLEQIKLLNGSSEDIRSKALREIRRLLILQCNLD
ncbi:MAG: hypothetical protein HXX09_10700 [Bacteroidetes bacterium]|nr:hypothetical protein [Bacteroidota bacterium]